MAATVTETRKIPGLRGVRTRGTIVLSGTYTTGGEPIAIPKPGTTKASYTVDIQSRNGSAASYGWDNANQKLKVFTAPNTELGNGLAYPAAVLADTIDYDAEFPKLG